MLNGEKKSRRSKKGLRPSAAKMIGLLTRFIDRNRLGGVLIIGFLVIAGRLSLLGISGIPQPAIADEFSYLFMADTFAAGRLTNPPHPLWTHFEPLFVLSHPTYASVYPVAQGLILAAGKLIIGSYWAGVLAAAAILGMAICWML